MVKVAAASQASRPRLRLRLVLVGGGDMVRSGNGGENAAFKD
jgi:hypothetical protein